MSDNAKDTDKEPEPLSDTSAEISTETSSTSTFSKLKNFASKMKKAALNTLDTTMEKIDAMVLEAQEEDTKPFNWENKDAALKCRQCDVTFNILHVFKRHCKLCGGVFCEDCATYENTTSSSGVEVETNGNNALMDISYGNQNSSPRICGGCRRGQTPSDRMMAIVEKLFIHNKYP